MNGEPTTAGITRKPLTRRYSPYIMRIREGEEFKFEGVIESIRYSTDDGDFQVVVVRTDRRERITCVVRGAALMQDERVAIVGDGARHRSGEMQIEVREAHRKLPATREGLVRFLSSPIIEGIGEHYAERIVDAFGEDTFRVLTDEPHRLREVPGIGAQRAKSISESWGRSAAIRGILIFLQSNGISPAFANRIFRRYGPKAVAVVKENPYRLARDVRGIGFQVADRIARNFGIDPDDNRRIEAGIEHALYQARGDGHVFLPEAELAARAAELLRQPIDLVTEPLNSLVDQRVLVREQDPELPSPPIYPIEAFKTENAIARSIAELIGGRSRLPLLDEKAWTRLRRHFPFELSKEQERGIADLAAQPVGVLTGGPGTGKTTIVRALVEHARGAGLEVLLAAPTGRAAQRLSESTDQPASTIHRLLEFDPRAGSFTRDAVEPLVADLLVVDEASMIDAELARALLDAVAPGTAVVFVGDEDQLPPVGAGRLLADLIASGVVPVSNLNRVFRQGERSDIVVASHEVRSGMIPHADNRSDSEFFYFRRESPERIVDTVVELVTERLPTAFDLDPVRDIQVLVPVHRGQVGTREISSRLQAKLGGTGSHVRFGESEYHVGDKVMQIRNNYRLETFNGDIGTVESIDVRERKLTVSYDGRRVVYERDDLDELVLAYAISVHKSQGSEFPAVVLVLATHHFKLLQRKLVYTGMTRARRLLVIVGMKRAVEMAVENISGVQRYSGLAGRLRARLG